MSSPAVLQAMIDAVHSQQPQANSYAQMFQNRFQQPGTTGAPGMQPGQFGGPAPIANPIGMQPHQFGGPAPILNPIGMQPVGGPQMPVSPGSPGMVPQSMNPNALAGMYGRPMLGRPGMPSTM